MVFGPDLMTAKLRGASTAIWIDDVDKTLEDTLAIAKQHENGPNPMPFLMLATWNDYEEGTTVENGVANCK